MVTTSTGLKKPSWIKLISTIAKSSWSAADGKKTISGLAMVIGGGILYFIPGGQPKAMDLFATGIPILVIGIAHKLHKHKKKAKGETK